MDCSVQWSVFSGQCLRWYGLAEEGVDCSVQCLRWYGLAEEGGWIAITQRCTEKKEIHGENLLVGVGLAATAGVAPTVRCVRNDMVWLGLDIWLLSG